MADLTNHWQICSCGEVMSTSAAHTFDKEAELYEDLHCEICDFEVVHQPNFSFVSRDNDNSDMVYFAHYEEGVKTSSSIYTYTYDANGNQLTKNVTYYDGNDVLDSIEKQVSTYDANGNELTWKITEYNSNNEVISIDEYTYTYDAHDNKLSEKRVISDGAGNVTYMVEYLYTYDEQDNRMTDTTIEYNNDGKILSKYIIEYDSEGNTLSRTIVEFDSEGNIIESLKGVFAYDENGMLSTIHVYFNDAFVGIEFYEPDEYGEPILVKTFEYADDGSILVSEYEDDEIVNQYWTDADGNIIEK